MELEQLLIEELEEIYAISSVKKEFMKEFITELGVLPSALDPMSI